MKPLVIHAKFETSTCLRKLFPKFSICLNQFHVLNELPSRKFGCIHDAYFDGFRSFWYIVRL
ncbi:hypothetical protein BX600DRAFT_469926 [Xylariales sp. PMI_506]|nr:hypothetical protein BX600DRAFT_469926 [Xylariales sp. PMI_506]